VDLSRRRRSWLTQARPLFVRVPPEGSVALLTGYCGLGAEFEPIDVEIQPLDRDAAAADDGGQRFGAASLVVGVARERTADGTGELSFEVRASIRGKGEVRFIDSTWVGRLGPSRWIESLNLVARGTLPLPPVEYKALTAGGEETPWTEAGIACGSGGAAMPLTGFAMRQRPGSAPPLFDCEYRGCFGSGVIAGPARNGAPCLSPTADDPMEGLEIRLTARPARSPSEPAG
jgi:hypothetical protein